MKTIQFKLTFLLILALGLTLNSCVEDDEFEIPDVNAVDPNIPEDNIVEIGSILGTIAQNDGENFTIESDIYVEGYVVSSDEAGNFFEEIIIQDKPENPTAGIRISINVNPLFSKYDFGRRILVKLQGLTVGITNGVAAIGTVDGNRIGQIQESQADIHLIRTSEVADIVPLELEISDVNAVSNQEDSFEFENLYVQFNSVQFPRSSVFGENPLTFAAEDFDQFDGERTLVGCAAASDDCGGGGGNNTIILSTSTFSDFRFLGLPDSSGSIAGVLSRDFFNEFYILAINDTTDINFGEERCDPLVYEFGNLQNSAANSFINLDFESSAVFEPVNVPGWTNYVQEGTNTWETFTDDGTNESLGISSRIGAFGSDDECSIGWLISPLIPITSNQLVTLEFKTSNSFSDSSSLEVLFSSDWDGTEAGITSATWGSLEDATIVDDDEFFGNWVSSNIVDLSAIGEDGYFAFKYTGNDVNDDFNGTYELDEIEVNVE
jgi:hypothetical protein